MNDPMATLREKLRQLEDLHGGGTLGAEAYAAGKARLEREIIDQVMAAPVAPAAPAAPAAPRPSSRLVASLAVMVVVVAAAGYAWTGSPGLASAGAAASQAAAAAAAPAQDDGGAEQFAEAVEKLALKLKDQPDNAEGWAMLARSYARLGRGPESLPAFAKAVALNGSDARLLADYAGTLALSNDSKLEGEPLALIERALKIEPDNLKALALAGSAAFERKDFAGAVRFLEQLVRVAPPDSALPAQLQSSIAQARQQAGIAVAPASAAAAAAAPAPATATAKASVRGTVRLASAIAKLASPNDTVFIFARAAEGGLMPLAIVRKQVKDLPFEFTLDDSSAMSPASRLSLVPTVVISARVSKSGQAEPAPGDLAGQSALIANVASGVLVEINDVVKP